MFKNDPNLKLLNSFKYQAWVNYITKNYKKDYKN